LGRIEVGGNYSMGSLLYKGESQVESTWHRRGGLRGGWHHH